MVDYAVAMFKELNPDKRVPEGEFLPLDAADEPTILRGCAEYAAKRENVVSTNERLQQEAQAVLDVIENLDVAQALRQDDSEAQNPQYLKDNYNDDGTRFVQVECGEEKESDLMRWCWILCGSSDVPNRI
ncbi:hypothetical protein HWV62_26873 [Athelia sp. TMB]|nr:hypothetical protein HWV62_26873 [Athelia sp. TMB]